MPVKPVTDAVFEEFETQLAELSGNRVHAALNAAGMEHLWLTGDGGGLQQYIANTALPLPTDEERKKVRLIIMAAAQVGAKSVSAKATPILWLRDPTTIDAAVNQFFVSETAFLLPAVGLSARKALEKKVKKFEIEPVDFGYVPLLAAPSWQGGQVAITASERMNSLFSANLTVSRLINYGALSQMLEGNVTEYRLKAKLDERTTVQCRALDGKQFKVQEAFGLLTQALLTTDPEQLKAIHPWMPASEVPADGELDDDKLDELRDKGYMVPPFHPRCRTVCVPVWSSVAAPAPKPRDVDFTLPATSVPTPQPVEAALANYNVSLLPFLGTVAIIELLRQVRGKRKDHPELQNLQDQLETELQNRGEDFEEKENA